MKFPIGQMSIGDILDRGLKLLLARLGTFYAINVTIMLPVLLLTLLIPVVPEGSGALPSAAILLIAIALIQVLILQPIGVAASLHVISQEFVDRRISVGQAFEFAMSRFGPLLGATLMVGLMVVGVIIVCMLPGIALLAGGTAAGALLMGLGMIVALVVALIIYLRYAFVSQVVVVEGKGAMESLPRSSELSEGFRGRIFSVMFLVGLVGFVLGLLAAGVAIALPYQEAVSTGFGQPVMVFKSYPNYVINKVVEYLINILAQSYGAVCLTLLYFDLRIRKEGFDLEMAAQQQMAVQ